MKKSIFSKLMKTYSFILIMSYCVVAAFLSTWFYNNYFDEKRKDLINEGLSLGSMLAEGEMFTNKEDVKVTLPKIQSIDKLINARIWVIDRYGYVLAYSGKEAEKLHGKQLPEQEISMVNSGRIVSGTDYFKDMFKQKMLSVGVPVSKHGQILGSVFIHAPVTAISGTLERVFFVIWSAAFFAIILSAFIVFYFSNKIILRPLSNINATAKAIAKGEFDKRVDIESDDEVGDLALSFNYMADSLTHLEDMRKSFIANISHELRSPMTSINGFITGMLDDTIPKDKWPHYLEIVNDEIKRLIRLINNLLDLASLESGKFSLNIDTFDLNALIVERVIKFEDKINKKNINMDVVIQDGKQWVIGDRDRIDQVLTNLIDNAIKFVPEKGILKVSAKIKEEHVLVSVYNNGKGIPKEEIKYIWDRFHMADKARSKGKGTGLGLSIAREIINQHGQTIWVESNEDSTVFTFTLALA